MLNAAIRRVVADQNPENAHKYTFTITWYAIAVPDYEYIYILIDAGFDTWVAGFLASPVASDFDFGEM